MTLRTLVDKLAQPGLTAAEQAVLLKAIEAKSKLEYAKVELTEGEPFENPIGKITWQKTGTKWRFSDKTEKMTGLIDKLKKMEKEDGTAYTVGGSVTPSIKINKGYIV